MAKYCNFPFTIFLYSLHWDLLLRLDPVTHFSSGCRVPPFQASPRPFPIFSFSILLSSKPHFSLQSYELHLVSVLLSNLKSWRSGLGHLNIAADHTPDHIGTLSLHARETQFNSDFPRVLYLSSPFPPSHPISISPHPYLHHVHPEAPPPSFSNTKMRRAHWLIGSAHVCSVPPACVSCCVQTATRLMNTECCGRWDERDSRTMAPSWNTVTHESCEGSAVPGAWSCVEGKKQTQRLKHSRKKKGTAWSMVLWIPNALHLKTCRLAWSPARPGPTRCVLPSSRPHAAEPQHGSHRRQAFPIPPPKWHVAGVSSDMRCSFSSANWHRAAT